MVAMLIPVHQPTVVFSTPDVVDGMRHSAHLVLCNGQLSSGKSRCLLSCFSCGISLPATFPEYWHPHPTSCGLFNTGGDTEPGYESRYPVIGSLSDKTHESTGVGTYFFSAGLCSLEDPGSLGYNPQGIYYSGCLNWAVVYPRFGSHYYYSL